MSLGEAIDLFPPFRTVAVHHARERLTTCAVRVPFPGAFRVYFRQLVRCQWGRQSLRRLKLIKIAVWAGDVNPASSAGDNPRGERVEDITPVVRSNEQVVFSPSIAPLLSSTCVLHSLVMTQNQPKRAISPEEQSAPADRWQAGDITLGGITIDPRLVRTSLGRCFPVATLHCWRIATQGLH